MTLADADGSGSAMPSGHLLGVAGVHLTGVLLGGDHSGKRWVGVG